MRTWRLASSTGHICGGVAEIYRIAPKTLMQVIELPGISGTRYRCLKHAIGSPSDAEIERASIVAEANDVPPPSAHRSAAQREIPGFTRVGDLAAPRKKRESAEAWSDR